MNSLIFKNRARSIAVVLCCALLGACSGRISTKDVPAENIEVTSQSRLPSPQEMSQATYAVEAAIADGCLKAWRTAIAGDYKGALKQLDELQHRYPKSPTISSMKAQVLDLSGDKKGAAQYYREGIRDNEFGFIQRFKLAEVLRTTGDIKNAEKEYRLIIKTSPEFLDARLGLAKVLRKSDPSSKEAEQELREILKIDNENKEALAMLEEMEKSPQSLK
jgi:tetratricopeptide (TPR) repeat protein